MGGELNERKDGGKKARKEKKKKKKGKRVMRRDPEIRDRDVVVVL